MKRERTAAELIEAHGGYTGNAALIGRCFIDWRKVRALIARSMRKCRGAQ